MLLPKCWTKGCTKRCLSWKIRLSFARKRVSLFFLFLWTKRPHRKFIVSIRRVRRISLKVWIHRGWTNCLLQGICWVRYWKTYSRMWIYMMMISACCNTRLSVLYLPAMPFLSTNIILWIRRMWIRIVASTWRLFPIIHRISVLQDTCMYWPTPVTL